MSSHHLSRHTATSSWLSKYRDPVWISSEWPYVVLDPIYSQTLIPKTIVSSTSKIWELRIAIQCNDSEFLHVEMLSQVSISIVVNAVNTRTCDCTSRSHLVMYMITGPLAEMVPGLIFTIALRWDCQPISDQPISIHTWLVSSWGCYENQASGRFQMLFLRQKF